MKFFFPKCSSFRMTRATQCHPSHSTFDRFLNERFIWTLKLCSFKFNFLGDSRKEVEVKLNNHQVISNDSLGSAEHHLNMHTKWWWWKIFTIVGIFNCKNPLGNIPFWFDWFEWIIKICIIDGDRSKWIDKKCFNTFWAEKSPPQSISKLCSWNIKWKMKYKSYQKLNRLFKKT